MKHADNYFAGVLNSFVSPTLVIFIFCQLIKLFLKNYFIKFHITLSQII